MSIKATYYLDNIKKNDIMSWSLSSQTGTTGTITLQDDNNKIYFTAKKSAEDGYAFNVLQPSVQSAVYTGEAKLKLVVTLDQDTAEIKQNINAYSVVEPKSQEALGCGYNIFIEDSTDNDYNDYYVNVVAWSKQN